MHAAAPPFPAHRPAPAFRAMLLAAGLCGTLAGCMVFRPGITSGSAPPSPGVPAVESAYTLAVGDEIDVRFIYTPELNERQVIRPDGVITMPLIGDRRAAGRTVPELKAALQNDFARELKRPDLYVVVRQFGPATVYVGGEVNQPGAQALTAQTTVLQAVMHAQGFKNSARISQVLVIHKAIGPDRSYQVVDLERVLAGTALAEDIPVAPNDVVYVPRTPVADVGVAVEQYLRNLLPVDPS
jgi:protein involved in polysaccharide export with SLBB domain